MYSLKVSPETLEKMKVDETTNGWVKESYELFQQCLAKKTDHPQEVKGGEDINARSSPDIGSAAIQLTEEQSLKLNLIIELAQ